MTCPARPTGCRLLPVFVGTGCTCDDDSIMGFDTRQTIVSAGPTTMAWSELHWRAAMGSEHLRPSPSPLGAENRYEAWLRVFDSERRVDGDPDHPHRIVARLIAPLPHRRLDDSEVAEAPDWVWAVAFKHYRLAHGAAPPCESGFGLWLKGAAQACVPSPPLAQCLMGRYVGLPGDCTCRTGALFLLGDGPLLEEGDELSVATRGDPWSIEVGPQVGRRTVVLSPEQDDSQLGAVPEGPPNCHSHWKGP